MEVLGHGLDTTSTKLSSRGSPARVGHQPWVWATKTLGNGGEGLLWGFLIAARAWLISAAPGGLGSSSILYFDRAMKVLCSRVTPPRCSTPSPAFINLKEPGILFITQTRIVQGLAKGPQRAVIYERGKKKNNQKTTMQTLHARPPPKGRPLCPPPAPRGCPKWPSVV